MLCRNYRGRGLPPPTKLCSLSLILESERVRIVYGLDVRAIPDCMGMHDDLISQKIRTLYRKEGYPLETITNAALHNADCLLGGFLRRRIGGNISFGAARHRQPTSCANVVSELH